MLSSRLSLFKPKQEIQDLKSTLANFNLKIDNYCSSKTKEITRLNTEFDLERREVEQLNSQLSQEFSAELEIKDNLESTLFDLGIQVSEKRQTMDFLDATFANSEMEISQLNETVEALKSKISSLNSKIESTKKAEQSKKSLEKPILEFYENKLGLKLIPIENGSNN